MKTFRYETHLHTAPASKCGRASVRESLEFYKSLGYEGVFITNHFIDGNVGCDKNLPYEEQIAFYFADYEEGVRLSEELDIRVFFGIESSYRGTDFLVYGLDKSWFLAHLEIQNMKQSEKLSLFADAGAMIVQAHPFREREYIDHIRLFPRHVHGVETYNASENRESNDFAARYADCYGLFPFAGSDNHRGGKVTEGKTVKRLGGMETDTPIADEQDFILQVKSGQMSPFYMEINMEDA